MTNLRADDDLERPAVEANVSTDDQLDLAAIESMQRRRAEIGSRGLRDRVARGTLVNSVYLLAMNGLSIVQGLVIARLLGAKEYGLWGLLAISFGTLFALASVGVDDKYIQQDHPDQQAAFEIAFTLQLMLAGLLSVIALVGIPALAILYNQPRIIVPGVILAAGLPVIALQTPIWVFYRRMSFVKQRILESIAPVVGFVVALVLALAGYGFWSIIIGSLAGAVAASMAAVWYSPYKLRLRYERAAMKEYTSFSWPLFVSNVTASVTYQVPMTLAIRAIGSAAVGALTLSSQITQYTRRVDDIVTHAMYPAICVVKDRKDLLFESFSKSNRLAVLWGFPTGIGVTLFAPSLVNLLLGEKWKLAVPLMQVLGVSAALDQIGFNWSAIVRARAETRALAVAGIAAAIAVLGLGVPLLLAFGLPGFAVAIGAGTVASLAVRIAYLARLFPAFRIVSHVGRATSPALLAAAAIVLERAVRSGGRSPLGTVLEAATYVVLAAIGTWLFERDLLREAVGYLRRSTPPAAPLVARQ